MKRRILFVNPRYGGQDGLIILPLDQASTAAYALQRGHDVRVVDLAFEADDARLEQALAAETFDLIVITCITICFRTAIAAARAAKAQAPDTPIAMMGEHVTYRREETLRRHTAIDFVIAFEAEVVVCELVEAVTSARDWTFADYSGVEGVTYRASYGDMTIPGTDRMALVRNHDRKSEPNLDVFPPPAKHLYALRHYLERDHETTMVTTRGCTHTCHFCHRWRYGRAMRNWSLPRVFLEIDDNLRNGFSAIFFQDDVFCYDKQRTRAFCEGLMARGIAIDWNCNVRIDDFDPTSAADGELAALMRKAGCYRIFVGIEAFDQELLDRSRKQAQVELIHGFVRFWQERGIQVHASYIVGLPGDTPEKVHRRVELAIGLKTDLASFNRIFPHPGTPFGDDPPRWGLQVPDPLWYEDKYWWTRAVAGTKELPPDDVYALQQWALTNYTESMFAEPA
jgi:anaerobic magnesium-protoporphyrin IX monomethyl ester cyclase